LPDSFGDELWTIVRTDVIGWALLDKEIGQDLQNVIRPEAARHFDGQALPSELIDHGQNTKGSAIVCAEPPTPDQMCERSFTLSASTPSRPQNASTTSLLLDMTWIKLIRL